MRAQDIIDRVGRLTHDQAHVRWPVDDLLLYISDAQQQIVQLAPAANSVTDTVALTANQSRQQAPADAVRILSVARNMGTGGNQPGRAIVLTSRAAMDAMDADWHLERDTEVQHWIYNPDEDRRTFYVYPAPSQAVQVEMTWSKVPAPVTSANQTLELSDHHINPVVDWVAYRCFSEDGDYGGNAMRAQQHAQAFTLAMGAKADIFQATNPNMKRRGGEAGGQI